MSVLAVVGAIVVAVVFLRGLSAFTDDIMDMNEWRKERGKR